MPLRALRFYFCEDDIMKRLSRHSLSRALDVDSGLQYSKAKLEKFRMYQDETSVWKIITYCLLLLEPIIVVIPVFLLPLESIQKGLSDNNWFQILNFCTGCTYCGIALSIRHQKIVSSIILPTWKSVLAALSMLLCGIPICTLAELCIVYPLPFVSVLLGAVGIPPIYLFFLWFERKSPMKERKKIIKDIISMGYSFTSLLLHEAIGILYISQKDNALIQSAVALLLPATKFLLRFLTRKLLKENELGTALITFEVEFFNTLYTSIFMQTATNSMVVLSLMSVDIIENVMFLVQMNRLASKMNKCTNKNQVLRELLHKTKMAVLVEVVEVITPIIYGAYIITVRFGPNLLYNKGLSALSDEEFENAIVNLLILVAFELFSLVSLIGTLKFRFNLPLFHQVGFFIQQHKWIILCTMNLWTTIAFITPWDHSGHDYSFQFDSENFKMVV